MYPEVCQIDTWAHGHDLEEGAGLLAVELLGPGLEAETEVQESGELTTALVQKSQGDLKMPTQQDASWTPHWQEVLEQ